MNEKFIKNQFIKYIHLKNLHNFTDCTFIGRAKNKLCTVLL